METEREGKMVKAHGAAVEERRVCETSKEEGGVNTEKGSWTNFHVCFLGSFDSMQMN